MSAGSVIAQRAPICRGQRAADEGTMLALCGGKLEVFDRGEPIYRAFCKDIVHLKMLAERVDSNARPNCCRDSPKCCRGSSREVQEELARTRKKTERVEAKVEAAPAGYPAGPPAAAGALITKGPPLLPPPERVKVTVGGFIAAETVWRQGNEVADIGSNFGAIPYPFSPLYNENEFHGTARQSRISLLVEGNLDPFQKLTGFYETDFLGVGTTSNYNQSNSWAARLRHAYFTYDNSGWGFHFLAGPGAC
jgi:hypothetical protein